jgi:hypothetical protein
MDKAEARRVLADEVGRLRGLSYADFSGRIPARPRRVLGIVRVVEAPQVETRELTAESGTTYQLMSQVIWDGKAGRDIRVLVAVDDGGWSAYKPLTYDFILAPDGSFVGE